MRAQSREHVGRCESATTPASECRCRCGGKCHGRNLNAQGIGREYFEWLPAGDPHHLRTAAERRSTRRTDERRRRQLKRRSRLDGDRRRHIEHVRGRNPEMAAELEQRWFGVAA